MTDDRDPTRSMATRVATVLAQMTLAEKIGQITPVEKNSLTPDEVRAHGLGSVPTTGPWSRAGAPGGELYLDELGLHRAP